MILFPTAENIIPPPRKCIFSGLGQGRKFWWRSPQGRFSRQQKTSNGSRGRSLCELCTKFSGSPSHNFTKPYLWTRQTTVGEIGYESFCDVTRHMPILLRLTTTSSPFNSYNPASPVHSHKAHNEVSLNTSVGKAGPYSHLRTSLLYLTGSECCLYFRSNSWLT